MGFVAQRMITPMHAQQTKAIYETNQRRPKHYDPTVHSKRAMPDCNDNFNNHCSKHSFKASSQRTTSQARKQSSKNRFQ